VNLIQCDIFYKAITVWFISIHSKSPLVTNQSEKRMREKKLKAITVYCTEINDIISDAIGYIDNPGSQP